MKGPDELSDGVDLHRRRRVRTFRRRGDPAHQAMARLPRIQPVDLQHSAIRTPVAEESLDQRTLARAVAAEQGVDRTFRHVQVEPGEGGRPAVAHGDVANQNVHGFLSWEPAARKASKIATAAALASKPRPAAVAA
jgi:hypothetical protein